MMTKSIPRKRLSMISRYFFLTTRRKHRSRIPPAGVFLAVNLMFFFPYCLFADETPSPSPAVIFPTGTPTPTPGEDLIESRILIETMSDSVGSQWPLKPRSNLPVTPTPTETSASTAIDTRFGLIPSVTTLNNTFNDYIVEIVQGLFHNDMWREGRQSEDFAQRTIQMIGSANAAVSNVASGPGLTRNAIPVLEPSVRRDQKKTIGTVAISSVLRAIAVKPILERDGNKYRDNTIDPVAMVGWACFSLDTDGFADQLPRENDNGGENYIQYHVQDIIGRKDVAMIGRPIVGLDDNGDPTGPVDARLQSRKEDDIYDIKPAVVDQLIGSEQTVYVDNKKLEPFSEPQIQTALSLYSCLIALGKASWVNANKARPIQVNFEVDDRFESRPGQTDFRPESRVGRYVGIEVNNPDLQTAPDGLIESCVGAVVFANAHYALPPENRSMMDSSLSKSQTVCYPEKKVAMIARGDVVVGDSTAPAGNVSGFDTSILEINGGIHLSPRASSPALDSKVAPPHRAGLVYFDAQRNALRVSVAAPVSTVGGEKQGSADWRQTEVAWVDVGLDTESIVPSRDIAGGPKEPGRAAFSLAAATRDTVIESLESARTLAVSGVSPYLRPSARVIPPPNPLKAAALGQPTTLLMSGFDGLPRIFWRRAGVNHQGDFTSSWREISSSDMESVPGLPGGDGAVSALLDFTASDSRDGHAIPPAKRGDIILFLLVDSTSGQTATTSFELGGG